MGAFFLFKQDIEFNHYKVEKVFQNKGFKEKKTFQLRDYELWLYSKQLLGYKNYFLIDPLDIEKGAVFAVGTLTYKGLDYEKSLELILKEFIAKRLNLYEIYGNYAIIFYKHGKIKILVDPMKVYSVFVNSEGSIFSSSFIAVSVADEERRKLNKIAIMENILTGLIIGGETIFKNIRRISNCEKAKVNNGVKILSSFNFDESRVRIFKGNRCEAIHYQIEVIWDYLTKLNKLITISKIDIGLSGGYDSTLLFALLTNMKGIKDKLTVHTHWKNFVSIEEKVAFELVKVKNVKITHLPAPNIKKLSLEEFLKFIKDAFYFYDAQVRVNRDLFSYYRTREYRVRILGDDIKVALSGEGGEKYRNYNYLRFKKMSLRDWLINKIITPLNYRGILKNFQKKFVEHISQKIRSCLRISEEQSYVTLLQTKRYFAEIWFPYGVGVRNNAENQLVFFVSPFTEYIPTIESYKTIFHLGNGGEFESAMISLIDKDISRVRSTYGFSFYRYPIYRKFTEFYRNLIPLKIRNILTPLISNRSTSIESELKIFSSEIEPFVKECFELIKDLGLPLEWKIILCDRMNFLRALSLGCILRFLD
ncbi:MAG: hypothetical protein DRG83_01860 [Deltaproteobacteria bacterium]|nr:MAG: hypothetical protein DRG83_01860 [Deltaproteobacteria bacterium]